jgi:hypothetical protein
VTPPYPPYSSLARESDPPPTRDPAKGEEQVAAVIGPK